MSKIQDVSSRISSKENNTEVSRQKDRINEKKKGSKQDTLENSRLEHFSTLQFDQPGKIINATSSNLMTFQPVHTNIILQQQEKQHQIQQTQTSESNILPILIDHIYSTLELSSSNQNNFDQLLFETNSDECKENFKLWIKEFDDTSINVGQRSKFNLKFVENILLADIYKGLTTLQDILKRVDICTLTKYNATLNPQSKLYLLYLISNLLIKLKIPEKGDSKSNELKSKFYIGSSQNKNNRYMINVFPEEINQTTKRWLSEKTMNSKKSSITVEFEKENKIADAESNSNIESNKVTNQILVDKYTIKTSMTKEQSSANDKCMKDLKNQHEVYEIKNNCDLQKESKKTYNSLEINVRNKSISYYHNLTTPTRYNKILAKKSKIKRANTIDIPNVILVTSDNSNQIPNSSFALKRPIDVGDKIFNGSQKVIPFFRPKTDNDRKFLALINKNTDTVQMNSISAFKSFNYHPAVLMADKTWSDRFSNIKTNFDKLSIRKKFENIKDINSKKETLIMGSVKELYEIKKKRNSFPHAATSLFQKIDKPLSKIKSVPLLLKSSYTPKNMLQDKFKMFDQKISKSCTHNNKTYLQSAVEIKSNKSSENSFNSSQTTNKCIQNEKMALHSIENDYLSYYPFGKQFIPSDNEKKLSFNGKSNVKPAKYELQIDINKNLEKYEIKKDKAKILYQKIDDYLLPSSVNKKKVSFLNQYSYCNSFESNSMNTYQNLIYQENIQNFRNPEKLTKNHEILNKNVAVPTINQPINKKRTSKFETSIENLLEKDPKIHSTKLNNFSSQMSPNISSIMQCTNQNYIQNLTNSNDILPTSNIHKIYEQQFSLSEITNIPNHSTDQYTRIPSQSTLSTYYNSNDIPNNNYHESNDYIYKSIPDHQQSYNNLMINNTLSTSHPIKQLRFEISKKLYNEFSKLPEKQIDRNYFIQDDSIIDKSVNNTVSISNNNVELNRESIPSKSTISVSKEKQMSDLNKESIQNQMISSDGIITHYTSAIATVSSMTKSSELPLQIKSPLPQKNEHISQIKKSELQYFNKTNISMPTKRKVAHNIPLDEIQDNILQDRIQYKQQTNNKIIPLQLSKELVHKTNRSFTNPSCYNIIHSKQCHFPNEKYKTQEKINLFEDKCQQVFQRLNISPKINIENSMLEQCNKYLPNKNNLYSTDSNEKYLISCANKSTRNIVLSKSESWHQLAIAKNSGNLHFPRSSNNIQQKPPKPKSSFSLKLSKQFEASSISDNMRKMEEKIQRYFQGSTSNSQANELKQTNRRGSKNSVQFNKNINSLSKSHTMPHLYDEKHFDENIDIDKVFDKIFQEATIR